jgi:hypothetical protein
VVVRPADHLLNATAKLLFEVGSRHSLRSTRWRVVVETRRNRVVSPTDRTASTAMVLVGKVRLMTRFSPANRTSDRSALRVTAPMATETNRPTNTSRNSGGSGLIVTTTAMTTHPIAIANPKSRLSRTPRTLSADAASTCQPDP